MHILVVNDDGPPSQDTSPFVYSLVEELKAQGHVVTVVLPNQQRSWIGKAHFVGEVVQATYFFPSKPLRTEGVEHKYPVPVTSPSKVPETEDEHSWMLVNSTPAGCVQIGLHHSQDFHDREGRERPIPIDLVVSGPNLGSNTTALFALSSGTIGGAIEAALCGKRAIAVSFEAGEKHQLPLYDTDMVTEASRHTVRLIHYLYTNWDDGVELYSVNVPLLRPNFTTGNTDRKVVYTRIRQNRWLSESPFRVIRSSSTPGDAAMPNMKVRPPLLLQWAPDLAEIQGSVDRASDMDDDWMVRNGKTSVTPLKANFMHVVQRAGEINLN